MMVSAILALSLSLAGDWTLVGRAELGEKIEVPCKVPGGVHSALITAGKLANPYYGMNEIKSQWVGRKNWTVWRDFDVSKETLAHGKVVLRIEHCDTFCSVRINGREVGKTQNRFRRYDFDVKGFLRPGRNRIEGLFESTERVTNEMAEKRAYPCPNVITPWAKNLALARTSICRGGWDWGISLVNMGFCGTVQLIASDSPWIDYVYTEQKFNEDLSHCTLEVYADLSDGSRRHKTIEIDDPPLWWPNGCGERRFYEFEAFGVKRRIGLRKLELLNEKSVSSKGKDELSVVFRINNRRIFCKGANWIPCDALESEQEGKYRDLLESAVAANMNMVRLWGGGQYERDSFYDICDELGLLVWHDMMEACVVYPADATYLDNIAAELRHQIRRLRDHASIALWCGDNECYGGAKWMGGGDKAKEDLYCGDWLKRSKFKGQIVAECDPTRAYWPSSPCCGPGDYCEGWKEDSKGDMHNWTVWHDNQPFDSYYRSRPRFCSEFGYQSFPSMEIAETFARYEDIVAHAPNFEWHQKNDGGNRRIRETMARYFSPPKDVESELLLSQFQQGMAMKMACDGWRAQRPRCMGTLIWQLNDDWPVASWSMIEYGGKWKPVHYLARRFYAPISVVAQPTVVDVPTEGEKQTVDVKRGRITVLNDTNEVLKGDVVAEYWSYDGQIVKSERLPVEVPPDSVKDAGMFQAVDDTFLVMNFKGVQNDWHFGYYKEQPLADAHVDVKIDRDSLMLTTDKPAFFVWANQKGVRGEFDDNAFTLLPGRPKKLVFNGRIEEKLLKVVHLKGITK